MFLHGVPKGRVDCFVHLIALRNLGAGGELEVIAGTNECIQAENTRVA